MSNFFDSSLRGTKQSQKKELLIVFVKNIKFGKVKTRLAKTIGNEGAFQVYKYLVAITESVTNQIISDKRIYYQIKG